MKTTTTTSRCYDLSAIMSRAWAIYRENSTDDLKAVFSICLQMAWAEAEGAFAADNAESVVAAWAAMSAADQVKIMTACVRKAAKNDIGYSSYDQYLQFDEPVAWSIYGHDFDIFVNETWLRVATNLQPEKLAAANERRAAAGKRPLTLVSLVYNCARAAISAIYYADVKHGRATVRTVIDDKGVERSYVETMASSRRDNTEAAAIIRADLAAFLSGRDHIDSQIVAGLWLGLSMREIAADVKLSAMAVSKRVNKMRDALRESYRAA